MPNPYLDYFSGLGIGGEAREDQAERERADALERSRREDFWRLNPELAPNPRVRALNQMPDSQLRGITERSLYETLAKRAAEAENQRKASYYSSPGRPDAIRPEDLEFERRATLQQAGATPVSEENTPARTDEPSTSPAPTAGTVDVTIDGKTYSYGGGQRGGFDPETGAARGPAPVLDMMPDTTSPSGYKAASGYVSTAFGNQVGRPLHIASPEGTGDVGPSGATGMVKLSPDSTTPMADQLRQEADARTMQEMKAAVALELQKKLREDPLYLEREQANIKGEQERASIEAAAKASIATRQAAVDEQRKMQAMRQLQEAAQEQIEAAKVQFAGNPTKLQERIRYIDEKMQIEASRRGLRF